MAFLHGEKPPEKIQVTNHKVEYGSEEKKETYDVKLLNKDQQLAAFVNLVPTRKFMLGYIKRIADEKENILTIDEIFVAPWAEGKGIGKLLFMETLRELQANPNLSNLKIDLITKDGAPFYQAILKNFVANEKILGAIQVGETIVIPKSEINFEKAFPKADTPAGP